MCIQKPPHDFSQKLYDAYEESIDEYINSTVAPSLREKSNEFLLRELARRWSDHKIMVRWLSRFFFYLDRYFVSRRSLPSLREAGINCFHKLIYEEFKCKAADAVIALINLEREENLIDKALLNNIKDMYVELGMNRGIEFYVNDLENTLLNDASDYYSRKASLWIVEDSCPDYMIKVEDCLKKEKARVSHYLHSSTETRLLEKVLHQLLALHFNELLEKEHSGGRSLLRDEKMEDLSRMNRLFQKAPEGLVKLSGVFKQHVSSEGMSLIKQADDAMSNKAEKTGGTQALELVVKIIELHDKYRTYVTDCFSNGSLFHKALKEAFEGFCNKVVGGSSSAEMLASYCDDILKKSAAEKLSSEAAEGCLDKAVSLLTYISDKDLFAEFYRKRLSRRLLFDRSAQDDQERFVLSKLKQQSGGQFTSKMEGMVNDMTLAKDSQKHFQEYLSKNKTSLGVDFTVTVITTGVWPTYKSSDLNLPAEMANCVQVFKDYYMSKTSHRKLTFIYSLGSCSIVGKFQHKPIELILGTYQAAVLLLFNSADKLSYAEIEAQLNLGDDDLIRLLHSLSCAKYKILNKDPSTKSISRNDSFEFNSKFTDRMRKIRVPLPPVDERKKVIEDVEKDRRHTIDAALVRIMKSRKVLPYQQLIAECVEQMSKMFKPEVKDIKRRIEDLITRDYLERDQESPNTFKYIA